MTINLSNDIANVISLSFPSEIKDVYFLRDVSCKAPKGKLYSKYFNTIKKLQSVGLKSNIKTHENNKKIVCRSEDQLNFSLEIDFCHMYSNCKNLSAKFERKSSLLLKIFDERIKDNANEKNLVIFYLMHSLFVPSSRKITRDDNGKKSVIKYSIKDSQNTFIIEASTPLELEVIIEKLQQYYKSVFRRNCCTGYSNGVLCVLSYFEWEDIDF
ncbi:hypothetical protein QTP88_011474 [Uroleucon formosanum]